ncbi:uncharacterized protein LOC110250684 [Exaiptasia diaphana]|uniref:Uncharacterized protein n=1 Tax=Exaiptasia diaphana TaxID=2652724 RepID=A0A913Y117_EXADI|nr:uncharacterized protein LOC110250684 [Exaiptasia diaphana]KXJ07393.1 hypothetical protein AC249_AIPGENE12733 [Exaiptasia diaphana]
MSETEYDYDLDNIWEMATQMLDGKSPSEKQVEKLYCDINKFCKNNPDLKHDIMYCTEVYFRNVHPILLRNCSTERLKREMMTILRNLFDIAKHWYKTGIIKATFPKSTFPFTELANTSAFNAGMNSVRISAVVEGFILCKEYWENSKSLASGEISNKDYRKRQNGSIAKSVMSVAGNGLAGYGVAWLCAGLSGPVGWAAFGAGMVGGSLFSYGCGELGRQYGEQL